MFTPAKASLCPACLLALTLPWMTHCGGRNPCDETPKNVVHKQDGDVTLYPRPGRLDQQPLAWPHAYYYGETKPQMASGAPGFVLRSHAGEGRVPLYQITFQTEEQGQFVLTCQFTTTKPVTSQPIEPIGYISQAQQQDTVPLQVTQDKNHSYAKALAVGDKRVSGHVNTGQILGYVKPVPVQ